MAESSITFHALVNPKKPAKCPFCGDRLPEGVVRNRRVIVRSTYIRHLQDHGVIRAHMITPDRNGKLHRTWECCCGVKLKQNEIVDHLEPSSDHAAECILLVSAGRGFDVKYRGLHIGETLPINDDTSPA